MALCMPSGVHVVILALREVLRRGSRSSVLMADIRDVEARLC